ncbi:MAG: UDP-N-acetyl glucosamine 2-epimerase [Acidobacteria bacterium]|nr:UDP-N-acetyl glucosamine 2-epimerase [Acidobacteriota bacterium]
MSEVTVLNVAGSVPGVLHLAPLIFEMKNRRGIRPVFVRASRNQDALLYETFFRDIHLPDPDIQVDAVAASPVRQAAAMMQNLEGILLDVEPDAVLLAGSENTDTFAGLAAVKLGFPLVHVDSGIRGGETPEEIDGIVTDSVSDLLFVGERQATANLVREGRPPEKIFFVGNVAIDSMVMNFERIVASTCVERLGLRSKGYAVLTLQHLSTLTGKERAVRLAAALNELQRWVRIIFVPHPRTTARLRQTASLKPFESISNLRRIDPLGYIDFIKLLRDSLFVVTDSGGVEEESTALKIPCLTLSSTTSHPVTVKQGSNRLVGADSRLLVEEAMKIIGGEAAPARHPEKWDGLASKRIVDVLLDWRERFKHLHADVRDRMTWPERPGRVA